VARPDPTHIETEPRPPRGTCELCGAREERFEVFDPETGELAGWEVSCPHAWRHGPQGESDL